MRIDPAEIILLLTAAQKQRLIQIAKAEKALPWQTVDEQLQCKGLVGKMTGPLNEPLASIGRDGWTVLNFMGR